MSKTLTIATDLEEIKFSDFDNDGDVNLRIYSSYEEARSVYLNKQNLISLKKHIDYLLSKE